MTITGTGVVNGETNRAALKLTASGATSTGPATFTMDEIVDDCDRYMHSPQRSDSFGNGKSWLLLRAEAFGDLFKGSASGLGAGASGRAAGLVLDRHSYRSDGS